MKLRSFIKLILFEHLWLRRLLVYYFVLFNPNETSRFAKELANCSDEKNLKKLLLFSLKRLKKEHLLLSTVLKLRDIDVTFHEIVQNNKDLINGVLKKISTTQKSFDIALSIHDFNTAKLLASNKQQHQLIDKIAQGLGTLTEPLNLAIENQRRFYSSDSLLIFNPVKKSIRPYSDTESVTTFSIPAYLVPEDAFDEIIEFYKKCIEIIYETDSYFFFQIQHWPYFYSLLSKSKVISYHTYSSNSSRNIHIKESAFTGYFTIDTKGYSGWHSINDNSTLIENVQALNQDMANTYHEKLIETFIKKNISKYEQKDLETTLPLQFIFLPLQVYNDSVAQLAYINTIELLDFMVSYCQESKINLVVKRHPRCPNPFIEKKIQAYGNLFHIHIVDSNIHELISKADLIVTVNSGVGFESILHLKPVITTGKCDYSSATLRTSSLLELKTALDTFKNLDINNAYKIKFLYYYFSNHLFNKNDSIKLKERLNNFLRD